jgi:hypothetical protein
MVVGGGGRVWEVVVKALSSKQDNISGTVQTVITQTDARTTTVRVGN